MTGTPTGRLEPWLADRASDPEWLQASRRRAAAWVNANGFPSIKHEDWRYTKIDAALSVPLVGTVDSEPEDVGSPVAGGDLPAPRLGGVRIVVVNGRVVPELSLTDGLLPGGAQVESLAAIFRTPAERLEQAWARPVGGYSHALRALNDAAATDGVLIELAVGAVVKDPIEVLFVSVPGGAARWCHPRVVVVAGAGASATLVETYLSAPDGPSVTNALTQVDLGTEAHLEHYVLQGEGLHAFHFSSLEARLEERSRLSSRLVATGGRIGRHEARIALIGKGAEVAVDGLFLTGSGQHHDNPVLVDHAAAGCRSRQLYKGIVSGDGHGIFNGHVVVRPGAGGTDATQVNKNLLLSERAEVDTRPRLEINADDVACHHGAAVGQLDADAVFYLRSRGLSEHDARAVLVSGFAREVLDLFGPGPLRQRAEQVAVSAGVVALDYSGDGESAVSADTTAIGNRASTNTKERV